MTTVINSQVSPQAAAESRPGKRHRTRNAGCKNDDGKMIDSMEGTKESPNEKIIRRGKKARTTNGEEIDEPAATAFSSSDPNTTSAAASPDGPARSADKETLSIGEDVSHTKRAFNGVLHNRLVAQRRKIDELRLSGKEKDRIINQYKAMWAKEKDKNQLLLNRLYEIEKKLASMTRPLQWSIKSMMSANSSPKKLSNVSASEQSTVI